MKLKRYYQKYFSKYYKELIQSIKWKQLLALLFSLLVGSLIYFYRFGISQMKTEIFNYLAYTISPFLLLSFLYIIFVGIRIHSDLYSELENEAFFYTWRDIDIQAYYFSGIYGEMVGLKVVNYKSPDNNDNLPLIMASPVITGIKIDGEDKLLEKELKLDLYQIKKERIYNITNEIMNQKYLPYDYSVIKLAELKNDQTSIMLAKDKNINIDQEEVFRIKIRIDSEINSEKMKPCYVYVDLNYSSKSSYDRNIDIKLAQRSPKFR